MGPTPIGSSAAYPGSRLQPVLGVRAVPAGSGRRRDDPIAPLPMCAFPYALLWCIGSSDGGDIGTGECICREAGIAPRPWVKSRKNDRVSSSLRKQKNSLTARAADVSLRLPPSRWLLAGAKPPPGPSPRSPVPADRLLRGATGTGSVSLTPGPPTVQGEPGIDYGGSRRTRSPLAGILRPTETSPTDRSNGYRRRPPE